MHSQTCEKKIIEKLYSNGLSISYDCVIKIKNNITKNLYQKYKETEIVCDDDDDELLLWYGWPTKGV